MQREVRHHDATVSGYKDTGSRKGLGPEHRSFQILINWAMSADNDFMV